MARTQLCSLAVRLAALCVCVCCSPPPAEAAQTLASASVTGTVRDTSEAVIPGATVELRNTETSQASETVTDARGRFRLLYLPVGRYQLAVRISGFGAATADLTLAIGDQIDVPVVLRPADLNETVNVEAAAPLVEARRTQLSATITPQEVDTLPINGRNYLDLATLAPNVSRTNLRSTDRFAETSAVPGTGISVAGQRNMGNSVIVDGLSANDDAADLAGTFFSEEVIREFQVVTSGGLAEFGRASSGTISVVTQSGTNRRTGRAYEFFRDDVFDAKHPLASRKDPLHQHQFGLSLAGPAIRNRTFWFGNIERTQLARTGVVAIAPAAVTAVNSALDAFGYAGPRTTTGNYATGYDTTNVFGRLDHQATSGSRLQGRYSLYSVASRNARNVGALNDISRGSALEDTDQTIAVNFLSTPSSRTINEARAQFTRSRLGAPVNDLVGPAVNISGVASFGTATSSPTARDLDVFEAVDTVTQQLGAHVVKAGVDVLYNRVNMTFPGALQGVYTFQSLANFERRLYSTYQQAFGAAAQFQSNPNLGLFVQDEWRPRSGVTLNLGVRYDLQWLPEPVQIDANNVSPRLGVALAPGDGRTVVRASGGIYYDRIPLRATSNALQRDGTRYQVAQVSFGQSGAPTFPSTMPSFPPGVLVSITSINPRIQDGHSEQASVEIERAIGGHVAATVGYSRLRGHGIIMSRNVNVPTLTVAEAAARGVANLGRPDPRFGNISQYDSVGDSWFNGLAVSVAARSAPWGRARLSYTWSQALDDAGNAFFQTPQDNFDILADKGPSDNDQRHRVVVSGTIGDGTSDAVRRALAGVQIGYVLARATGAPFNVVTGGDRNNDTTVNDRPQGVGRNSARLPGTSTFDVRLSRPFVVHRQRIEAMVEAFNLFNHVNVVNVNNTIGTGPTPSASFGQVTAIGDMRQIQLGVRWSF